MEKTRVDVELIRKVNKLIKLTQGTSDYARYQLQHESLTDKRWTFIGYGDIYWFTTHGFYIKVIKDDTYLYSAKYIGLFGHETQDRYLLDGAVKQILTGDYF